MARRKIVEYVDDLDGGPAQGPVRFGLDGLLYEIDLSEANTQELRTIMSPYLEAGRRVGGRRARTGAPATTARPEAIRVWARQNGYQVSSRGRVSREVQQAYDAAH